MSLDIHYTFNNLVTAKVVDNGGVVHEVEMSPPGQPYRCQTRCTQNWFGLEPVVWINSDALTTCITCISAHNSTPTCNEDLVNEVFKRVYSSKEAAAAKRIAAKVRRGPR